MLDTKENPPSTNSPTPKQEIRDLLGSCDIPGVLRKVRSIKYRKALMYLLFDEDKLIRWRAIDAIGKLAGLESKNDIEKVRDMIRRQFWMMNDESGALSWHGPEIIAEILYNVPVLLDEYAMILISYRAEEPFERGVHWAIHRLANLRPDIFIKIKEKLLDSLMDKDAAIRGYSLMALLNLKVDITEERLSILRNDSSNFGIFNFESYELTDVSIKEIFS